MLRREVLKGLMGLAIPGKITEVTSDTKVVIFSVPLDIDVDPVNCEDTRKTIRDILDRAGCKDVGILMTYGLNVETINKSES